MNHDTKVIYMVISGYVHIYIYMYVPASLLPLSSPWNGHGLLSPALDLWWLWMGVIAG